MATGVTTLYLRGMSTELVREAKAKAARRGGTLASVVSEALARSLEEDDARTGEADRELRASERWYARQRPSLLKRYRGQYVAIRNEAVIDHDADFAALAAELPGLRTIVRILAMGTEAIIGRDLLNRMVARLDGPAAAVSVERPPRRRR